MANLLAFDDKIISGESSGGGSSTGGHVIINSNGTEMAARSGLQFNGIEIEDDSINDKTIANVNIMRENFTVDTHRGYLEDGMFQVVSESRLILGNNIATGDGASFGVLDIYGFGQYKITIGADPSADRSISFPDKDGRLAITDDIIQSDWNQTTASAKDYIKNKPIITSTVTSGSTDLITSGGVYSYVDTMITQALSASY